MPSEQYFWADLEGKKKITFYDREFWVDEKYKWVAVDRDGWVHAYDCKPNISGVIDVWDAGHSYELGKLKRGVTLIDWKESLKEI